MNEMIIAYLPVGVLVMLFFAIFLILHKKFKKKNILASILKKHRESTDLKILGEAEFVTRFGSIENKSLLYKMDRLIITSGIKNKLPWMNGEIFLLNMVGLFIVGFFEGMTFFSNFFVEIFLATAQTVALYVIVKGLSGRTYNQIEDATAIFISILSNHAKGSSDIVTIMQKTSVSLIGPLRGIVEKFITDCESTGNIDVAFDYMKESVDNRQLKTIFVNLKNCMHYQANYEEVLVQMMGQVAAGLSAREDRKNILFSMRLTLAVISIIAVIIIWIIGAGLGINVKGSLTGNIIGQALLCITGFLYLLVGVKIFSTDK